ncbi:MAG: glycerol-3-phosphate acyltransferase [Planctomycetota bacterium]
MLPGLALWLAAAFVLGGVPFGFLAVRLLLGQDVRRMGSGNIGATNASRCFPARWRRPVFFAIWLLDMGKGWLPTTLAMQGLVDPARSHEVGALVGLAAVAGHCFSPFLGFKGGKGVSTVCGVLLALDPLALGVAILVFALVRLATGVVALGSMALGFALAATVILREPATAFGERLPVTVLCLFLALFLVWTHRENIRGLRRLRRQRRNGGEPAGREGDGIR